MIKWLMDLLGFKARKHSDRKERRVATKQDISYIIEARDSGMDVDDIAFVTNLSKSTVHRIYREYKLES